MGQAITRFFRRLSPSQPIPTPCPSQLEELPCPSQLEELPCPSRLEQLPPELKLKICEYLSPASLTALFTTCKSLRAVLIHNNMIGKLPNLDQEQRVEFLSLLERDLGNRFYVCTVCAKLHRFEPWWGPREVGHEPRGLNCPLLDDKWRLWPYCLGWYHVRLVMNRHLYGPEYGVPLQNLEAARNYPSNYRFYWGRRSDVGWHQEWSARIVNDELFLRAKHTIHDHHEHRLRHIIDTEFYGVCRHKTLNAPLLSPLAPPHWFNRVPIDPAAPLFVECEESLGSCIQCLTDFTIKVRLRKPGDADHNTQIDGRDWEITIIAYHQLGSGRSHLDWKWTSFSASNFRPSSPYGWLLEDHPPGMVMSRWLGWTSKKGEGAFRVPAEPNTSTRSGKFFAGISRV